MVWEITEGMHKIAEEKMGRFNRIKTIILFITCNINMKFKSKFNCKAKWDLSKKIIQQFNDTLVE